MATLAAILTAAWKTANVALPTIVTAPDEGPYLESRMLYIEPTTKTEDYIGVLTRTQYSPDSHDAYTCTVGSSTYADTEAIVDETRRICAEFDPTSADKILQWEGGDWKQNTAYWHELTFIIFKRKSGIALPNT